MLDFLIKHFKKVTIWITLFFFFFFFLETRQLAWAFIETEQGFSEHQKTIKEQCLQPHNYKYKYD